jgi:hypothetical protein
MVYPWPKYNPGVMQLNFWKFLTIIEILYEVYNQCKKKISKQYYNAQLEILKIKVFYLTIIFLQFKRNPGLILLQMKMFFFYILL